MKVAEFLSIRNRDGLEEAVRRAVEDGVTDSPDLEVACNHALAAFEEVDEALEDWSF